MLPSGGVYWSSRETVAWKCLTLGCDRVLTRQGQGQGQGQGQMEREQTEHAWHTNLPTLNFPPPPPSPPLPAPLYNLLRVHYHPLGSSLDIFLQDSTLQNPLPSPPLLVIPWVQYHPLESSQDTLPLGQCCSCPPDFLSPPGDPPVWASVGPYGKLPPAYKPTCWSIQRWLHDGPWTTWAVLIFRVNFTLRMTTVTNNSLSKDYPHPDNTQFLHNRFPTFWW